MAIQRSDLIESLRKVFHTYGYDGTSLSRIAEETGLGKGSLYHHFPGGKAEMAAIVLQAEGERFQAALDTLRQPGDPVMRLKEFADMKRQQIVARKFEASTLDVYTMGEARALNQQWMQEAVTEWAAAFQQVAEDAGFCSETARSRSFSAIAHIEGTRLLCRCLDNWALYDTMWDALPSLLLDPE